MIAVLLADGFEEIEALTPVDMLRRAGLKVVTIGISGKYATGSHGIKVECDSTADETDPSLFDAVIFPGGMPGATNLDASPFTDVIISEVLKKNGVIGAICAAPLVLGRRGLLNGKQAICYPGFENELTGASVADCEVVTDGKIVTAKGMGVALEFSKALISLLAGEEKAKEISIAICEK